MDVLRAQPGRILQFPASAIAPKPIEIIPTQQPRQLHLPLDRPKVEWVRPRRKSMWERMREENLERVAFWQRQEAKARARARQSVGA